MKRLPDSPVLFSDLDRTLIPNGSQEESQQARPLLHKLLAHSGLFLAYVSGRHLSLLQQAIHDYDLPLPHCAVGDVGTSIYHIHNGVWSEDEDWQTKIAPDWQGASRQDLQNLLANLGDLKLQEAEKQNTHKLSYYLPLGHPYKQLIDRIRTRFESHDINSEIIWSVDEAAKIGLLDIVPASATKLHAIEFIMQKFVLPAEATVFSGDSGNDLPVICSGKIQSVLVRNAHPEVITEARDRLAQANQSPMLYLAQGNFLHMNGNYTAGVLEGLSHFLPNLGKQLQKFLA